jgi:hypothetical protein
MIEDNIVFKIIVLGQQGIFLYDLKELENHLC